MRLETYCLLISTIVLNFVSSNSVDEACDDATDCDLQKDLYATVPEIIRRYGYPIEEHEVQTRDGYILTLFRIPANKTADKKGSPIFLQHGAFTSSATWIFLGRNSLSFKLSDRGYDVWLSNLRGSKYSTKHINTTVDNDDFFDYSMDEFAEYDLRDSLNYVFEKTDKASKIVFIGMSMGGAIFLMYASEHPKEANALIGTAINLAPAVYFKNSFPIVNATLWTPTGYRLLNYFGVKTIRWTSKLMNLMDFCYILFPDKALDYLKMFTGDNTNQLSKDRLLMIPNHIIDNIPIRVAQHYSQLVIRNVFEKYDFGEELNLEKYGTSSPPRYDLSKITLPIYFFYGKNDILATEENVRRLYEEVGSKDKHMIDIPRGNLKFQFDHSNFVFSSFAEKYLYPEILEVLKRND